MWRSELEDLECYARSDKKFSVTFPGGYKANVTYDEFNECVEMLWNNETYLSLLLARDWSVACASKKPLGEEWLEAQGECAKLSRKVFTVVKEWFDERQAG